MLLDLYLPESTGKPLPLIIWIHSSRVSEAVLEVTPWPMAVIL